MTKDVNLGPNAPTSPILVRWIFAAVFAFFALQLPLIYFLKAEPYPAITMPTFAGHPNSNGEIARNEASVVVEFPGGEQRSVSPESVLPKTRVLTGHVFTQAFISDSFTHNPQTVAWLKARVDSLFPGETPTGVEIIWKTAKYNVNDRGSATFAPLKTIHVAFNG